MVAGDNKSDFRLMQSPRFFRPCCGVVYTSHTAGQTLLKITTVFSNIMQQSG